MLGSPCDNEHINKNLEARQTWFIPANLNQADFAPWEVFEFVLITLDVTTGTQDSTHPGTSTDQFVQCQ